MFQVIENSDRIPNQQSTTGSSLLQNCGFTGQLAAVPDWYKEEKGFRFMEAQITFSGLASCDVNETNKHASSVMFNIFPLIFTIKKNIEKNNIEVEL